MSRKSQLVTEEIITVSCDICDNQFGCLRVCEYCGRDFCTKVGCTGSFRTQSQEFGDCCRLCWDLSGTFIEQMDKANKQARELREAAFLSWKRHARSERMAGEDVDTTSSDV